MPLTGVDDAISLLSGNTAGREEIIFFHKDSYRSGTTTLMPQFAAPGSTWLETGQWPQHAAIPGAASIPTRATQGALGQANATGGRTKYLTSFGCTYRTIQPVFLADRLAHMGGLSGAVAGPASQAVGLTINRYTSATEAVGNELWVEIYDTLGASAPNITATYTNENGTGGRTTIARAIGSAGSGLNNIGRMVRLPLQQGDLGVTACASVAFAAGSTGTAGNFGITIAKTLTGSCRSLASGGFVRNYVFDHMAPIPIKEDACLWLWDECSVTIAGMIGFAQFIEC